MRLMVRNHLRLWWRKFKIKCTGHLGCLLIRSVIRNNTEISEHMTQGHTESIDLIKCQIIIIIKFNVRMKPLGYGMPLLDGMFGGNMTLKRCCRTPTPDDLSSLRWGNPTIANPALTRTAKNRVMITLLVVMK